MKGTKAQSAMEYLMTYGWAILIIAVVLGALFSLGVFSGAALLGTACVAGAGFLCTGPQITSNGNLTFTFGQSTGVTMYNVGMACVAVTTSGGLPNPVNAMVTLTPTGGANGIYTPGNVVGTTSVILSLTSGQSVTVNALKCFNTGLGPLTSSNAPIGTAFSGVLFVNYTTSSAAASATNPMLTQKFATLSAKVV